MELELGLSMSNYNCVPNHKISCLKELDLINYVNCEAKQDDLSSLSCESSSVNVGDYDEEEMNYGLCKKKRRFFEAQTSEFCHQSKTLSLLFWDKQPNEDDNIPPISLCNSDTQVITKNEGDDIVGWPPVKTYRKRQNYGHQQQQQCGCHERNIPVVENGGCCGGGSASLYVKVQMEGCFIKRKINLNLFHSYDTLTSTLLHMFGKGDDCMDHYKLTYQDGEGNWLLARDVQWRMLIQTVRRLKMARKAVD